MEQLAPHELLSAQVDAALDELMGLDAALSERAATLLSQEDVWLAPSLEPLLAEHNDAVPLSAASKDALLEQLLHIDEEHDEPPPLTHDAVASSEALDGTDSSVDGSAADDATSRSNSPATSHKSSARSREREIEKPKPNTTRQRQAEELKYLRIKVLELEQELQVLQAPPTNLALGVNDDSQSSMSTLSSGRLWKRVAKSQLLGRQRAEVENAKLRETVVNQLKIVKGLEKILKKRVNEPDDLIANMRKRVRFGDESEVSVFAKLLRGLETRFHETDSVFQENELAASKTELQHAKVKVDAVHGLHMEFLDSKLVPFGMHRVQDALWRVLGRANIPLTDGQYGNVDRTHDFITAKMAFNLRHKRSLAVADAKFVAKRFVDEDRVVFVWTCQSDAEGSFCGPNGIQLMNYGWTVIERVASTHDGNPDDSDELTLIQSCARIIPQLPETDDDQEQQVGLLVDLVTGSFLRNMASFHQSAEDFLVEEALSGGQ